MAGPLLVLLLAAWPAFGQPVKAAVEVPVVAPMGGAAGVSAAAAAPAPTLAAPSLAVPVLPTAAPALSAPQATALAVPGAAAAAVPTAAQPAAAAAVLPAALAPAQLKTPAAAASPAVGTEQGGREALPAPGARGSLDGAAQATRGLDRVGAAEGAAAASLAFDGSGQRRPFNAVQPANPGFGRRPASGLAPSKAEPLPGLAEKGWSVAAPGAFVPDGLAARFEAFMKAKRASVLDVHGSDVIELYDTPRGWKDDVAAREDGTGGFQELLAAVEAELHAALPGERFSMRDAHVRVVRNGLPGGEKIHADLGGYMTLTLALDGPGTVLYLNEAGRWVRSEAPTGAVAVITNAEREVAAGAEATIHSAPNRVVARRTVLIVRYKPDAPLDPAIRQAVLERAKRRAESARRAFEPAPEAPTLGGFLKGLLGR
jgi:hypothetical protein